MTPKKCKTAPLKIGVIDFINSYPLFYPLRFGKIPTQVEFHVGTPREVNRLLANKEVDIGLISSVAYIDNRSEYILLSDYGIGAKEKVLSVCLFCQQPSFDFTKATSFLIPSYSMTSTRLLQTLSHFYWKSDATLHETDLSEEELFEQTEPFLLIGDTCLQKRAVKTLSFCDLAEQWHQATGLGFVFALIATRNDAFFQKQEAILQFHKSLIHAYSWSKQHEGELIHVCSKKLKICSKLTKEYFHTLDYELIHDHLNGLDHFASLCC